MSVAGNNFRVMGFCGCKSTEFFTTLKTFPVFFRRYSRIYGQNKTHYYIIARTFPFLLHAKHADFDTQTFQKSFLSEPFSLKGQTKEKK